MREPGGHCRSRGPQVQRPRGQSPLACVKKCEQMQLEGEDKEKTTERQV